MSLLNTNIGPERVQVFPVALGTVQVAGTATSILGVLISTTKVGAPVNVATPVNDLTTFVNTFGGQADIAHNAYYAVEGFFNNAGTGPTVYVVNVGAPATALSYIGNAGDGSGLRALDSVDNLGLVCAPGLPLEMAYLVHPAVIDYAEVVRAEFGATLSTTFSLTSIPAEITSSQIDATVAALVIGVGGVVGNVLTIASPYTGLASVTPGMTVSKNGTHVGTVTAVDQVAHKITLTTASGLAAGDTIGVYIPSAVKYKELVVNNPSKSNAWYMNHVLMLDESPTAQAGSLVTVDPVCHVAGVMARIDSNVAIGGVSHAPAGIQFAGIAGINGLALKLSERVDAAPLRLNFINRITSFPGAGTVIFGGYTSDSGTSPVFTADEQLVQVIRSLQFIKSSLEPGLRSFLWENFSPVTQAKITSAIQSFLRNNIYLFPAGLPESQQFQVIQVTPTQDELNQGLLRVRIQVKPNQAVRFIEIALEFPLPTA